jgi:outer membrane protein assembly factor BamA
MPHHSFNLPGRRYSITGLIVIATWMLWMAGCSATEHLQAGELLVKNEPEFNKGQTIRLDSIFRNPLENIKQIGAATIDPSLLNSSVKTHPNRRMLWPKTYLHLYNLGRTLQRFEYPPETIWKFFFPKSGLVDTVANFLVNTAGERPVLLDTAQLARDAENLRNVYFANGFWDAKIYPLVDTLRGIHSGKVNVTYLVEEGKAALIDKVRIEMDSGMARNVYFSEVYGGGILHTGDLYNEQNLNLERNRITNEMHNHGFYDFSPRQITFLVDKKPVKDFGTVPLNPAVKDFFPIHITVKIMENPPSRKVGNIAMVISPATFDPEQDLIMQVISRDRLTDSLRLAWNIPERMYSDSSEIKFISYSRVLERLNLNFLESEIKLKKGDPYSSANKTETQRLLQNLGIFKYVLIHDSINTDSGDVDFIIQTELLPRYQVKAGAEGFFKNDRVLRNNLPGVGGELGFTNKMVFKGAEKFTMSAKGNVSFLLGDTVRAFWDGSATASFRIPRIVVPALGRLRFFPSNPSTTLSLTFNRQQSREYTRNAASMDWSYNWLNSKKNGTISSTLSPFIITFNQSRVSQSFVDYLAGIENQTLRSLLAQDYRPRFSSVGRYKFTLSNYMSTRKNSTYFVQPLVEIGGNTPYLIDRFGKVDDSWHDTQLDNIFYGQFGKLSLEVKNYIPLGGSGEKRARSKGELVIRNYLGIADPWNFTRLLPFDARFYSGGTNSMRGWQSNTLGPGTYVFNPNAGGQADLAFLLSPGGEAVYEMNIELRRDVYQWVELALFADAGNVWFLPGSKIDDPRTKLNRNSYKHLGVDAGIGVRMDFSFFVFRMDLARKIYAPSIEDFVTRERLGEVGGNLFQLNFGIGYPF